MPPLRLRRDHRLIPLPRRGRRELIACLLLGTPLMLAAQTSTDGAIGGHLQDPGHQPIAATITARAEDTGLASTTRTTRSGDFLLPGLAPGLYTVQVLETGGTTERHEHVPVTLGMVTELPANAPAAPLAPTSLLSVGPAALELSGPDSSLLDPTRTPPAESQATPDSEAEGESLLSFRGLAATQNAIRIDGASATESFGAVPIGTGSPSDPQQTEDDEDGTADTAATTRNGGSSGNLRSASAPFTFARAAIREFHLTGDTYSALYGHAAGGILNAVTRSGGDRLHGSTFLRIRNSAFAATNPYAIASTYQDGATTSAPVKPNDAREQFGASLGGPILPRGLPRRPLFFFTAIEAQRRSFPAISSPQDPGFYNLTPTQVALLANRGVTQAATNTALDYLDSLTGETPRRSDGTAFFARLDQHFSQRFTASLEGNRARWNQPAAALSAPVVARARDSLGNTATKADNILARLVSTLSPFLSNDLRLQYSRDLQSQSPQPPLPQEPAISPGGLAPEVAIGPQGLTFGTPANLGRTAYPDERRLQLADLVSLVRGRQHLQAGFDFSAVHTFVSALPNQQGTFVYDSALTTRGRAGGLVDWITDQTFNVNAYPNGACPSIHAADHLFCFRSFTQSFGLQSIAFDTQEYAAFLQDDLRLPRNLTLHAGLRFDYDLLPRPQNPNPAIDSLFPTLGQTGIFPEDRNNIAPRIALAWQPRPRTTLRAGYGIFFGRLPGATIRTALLNTDLPTSTTHIRITPSTITACPQVQNQGFGYPCAYLASPASALATTTSATVFSRRFRLPAVQQASFTAEHEFPARIAVTATYRLNLDRQLPSSVDLNIAPSTTTATYQLQGGTGQPGVTDGETFVLPLYTARVAPAVGPVTAITSSANAIYHALTVEARRASRTLALEGSFTWSRAIDFNPTQGAIPRTDTQLDPFNIRYDKGLSSLNFPLRLAAVAVWQPRLATPSRLFRDAVSGWAIAPIFSVRSGTPYTFSLSGGTSLPGGHLSLNGSGGALYLPTVGRNTLRLPAATNLDLRLARAIPLRENIRLRLEAEAYNLANHVNIAGVTQRAYLVGTPVAGITPLVFQDAASIAAEGVNTRPFGTFTDSGTSEARARNLQFGLRLEF